MNEKYRQGACWGEALGLTALLLVGCGGGSTANGASTPALPSPTVVATTVAATPTSAALATTAAAAVTAAATAAATQVTPTPTAVTSAMPTATPLRPTPTTAPTATPVSSVSTSAELASTSVDLARWPAATPGGADPARESFDTVKGQYVIALTAADHAYVHWQYAPQGRAFGDFALEVDGQVLSGPPDGSWGVLFRAQPQLPGDVTNAGYDVVVTPGKQSISVNWTSANGQAKVLAQATVPAMHSGNAANHIRLTAKADRITVSVNGQTVGSVTGPSTTPGAIGLIVLQPAPPAGSAGTTAAFSHLVIAPLPAP